MVDLGRNGLVVIVRKIATKLAEMDGISNLGIETPSFEKYLEYNRKAIAAIQIVSDDDWLRPYAPGAVISLPGF